MTGEDLGGFRTAGQRPRLQLPYRDRSAGMLWCGLALAVIAVLVGVSGLLGEAGPPFAALATIGATALLATGLITRLRNRTWEGHLRRIEAGHFRIHWRYDDATWQRYRERMARRNDRLLWMMPIGVLAASLMIAVMVHADGRLFGGSVALTYVVAVGGGAVAGIAIGRGARWLAARSERLMAALPGECFIAEDGLYLTGQYRPWRSYGQYLTGVTLSQGEPRELHFAFRSRYRPYQLVHVPVPPGEEAAAAALVAGPWPKGHDG